MNLISWLNLSSFYKGRPLRNWLRKIVYTILFTLVLLFLSLQILVYFFPDKYETIDESQYVSLRGRHHNDLPFILKNRHSKLRRRIPKPTDGATLQQSCPYNVSIQTPGRLGNLMFAYASMFGIAKTLNRKPVISKDNPLRLFFTLTADVLEMPDDEKNWTTFAAHLSATYDHRVTNIPCNENLMLIGYFQSWRYFKDYEGSIRNEFMFKEPIQHAAVSFLNKAFQESFPPNTTREDVVIVGIHVRRSDMTDYENRKRGYVVASRQYIKSAMSYFEAQYHRLMFVVCSDDLFWVDHNVKSESFPVVYSDNYNAIVDLAILSLCDHVIITVGTFGWWGAYLSDGKTIYMSDFPRKHSVIASEYNHKDYFYPPWKGLPSK